jgi:translation initiation factor 3 subunit H
MQGGLSFRAIRLTTSFMELYRSGNFSAESIAKADLTAVDIFQEVPIQFHNTALIRALLHDYDMGNKLNCDFERLNLTCACALLRACLRISPSARAGSMRRSMRRSRLWLQARQGVDSA